MSIKCISITNAKSGMVLAKPVLDEQGRTLCSAEKELSGKLILRFEKMGIGSIYIQTNEKLSEEEYNNLKNDINERFGDISADSFLINIKEILLEKIEAEK